MRLSKDSPSMIVLDRISQCKEAGKEIIPFPKLMKKLACSLQIKKESVWGMLFNLSSSGFIKVIQGKGVKLLFEYLEDE